MSEKKEPNGPVISRIPLRYRWDLSETREFDITWQIYSVLNLRTRHSACLIQRSLSKSDSEIFRSKHEFAQYCSTRRNNKGWPLPKILDRFTDGDSLFLVEDLPGD